MVRTLSLQVPATGLRCEIELLLCCTRTCMDDTRAEKIGTLLQEDLDWEYLIQIALHHGIMPLLYRNLRTTSPTAVPKAALNQLQHSFYANAWKNVSLTRELHTILHLLEAQRIPAIPFKGPVLAASIYGNLTLRQFNDLDILVRRRDVLRAKDLLIAQGYHLQLTNTEAFFRKYRYHYNFVRHDGKVVVELHWAFTRPYWPFPLSLELLWERLDPVSLDGITVPNLTPEDLLLILCVHGAKHSWERLGWICDIAELIRMHQKMDWGRVMAQARTLGSQRMLFLGLDLARELLGLALPEDVLHRMHADAALRCLSVQIRKRLFSEADARINIYARDIFYLRMRERWRDRVPYLLHRLPRCLYQVITPNAKDRAFLPLPARLSCLYYVLRPIRVISDYGPRRLKRLLRLLWYGLRGR